MSVSPIPSDGARAAARGARARLRSAAAWLAVGAALAGTFSLYGRPDLMLDFGQLMALCGFR
jgi:hypothetical protein